jgi:hypothetical protein
MPLLDLATVKAQLNIRDSDNSQDSALTVYINAATLVVERHTGETTSPAEFTETLQLPGPAYAAHHPVTAITSAVDRNGDTVDAGSLSFDALTITGSGVFGPVTVTYQAGYVTAPANYELAGMIIVQHLYQSKRGGMPTASPSLDGDSAAIQPRTAFGFAIPRMALELLGAESSLGFA